MRCIQRFLARRILKPAPRPQFRRAQDPGAPPTLTGDIDAHKHAVREAEYYTDSQEHIVAQSRR